MPRARHLLTARSLAANVRTLVAAGGGRTADGAGLYVLVKSNGAALWRMDATINGARRTLSLGELDALSLADARVEADRLRRLVRTGVDPVAEKRAARAAVTTARLHTFEAVARDWIERQDWTPGHRRTVVERLERNLFPWIGGTGVAELTVEAVDAALSIAADRGVLETAHRVAAVVRTLYKTREVRALAPNARDMLEVGEHLPALPPKRRRPHFQAVTDPRAFGALLRKVHAFEGSHAVRSMLRLAPLVFLRPGELRQLEWSWVDLPAATIAIPGEAMKGKEPLLVPLSTQAVAILSELHPLTGKGGYVFPSPRSPQDAPTTRQRPLSNNTLNVALRASGVAREEHTGHGFRAAARTMIAERLGFRESLIERQLGHVDGDRLHGAYDRASHIEERARMMQSWADLSDTLRTDDGNVVVPFRSRVA